MRVLAVTNMYPNAADPGSGTFVEQQIQGLKRIGVEIEVLVVNRTSRGVGVYLNLGAEVRAKCQSFQPDLIHIMYGGVMAEIITRTISEKPFVISICGTDILGGPYYPFVRRMATHCGVFASRLALKRAQAIIVKSRNLFRALPDSLDQNIISIVPNGIDIDRFKPLDRSSCRKELGWAENELHVLFPSHSAHPRKRFALAEAAVNGVRAMGLAVQIQQLDKIAHEKIPTYLNAADAILLTSVHEGSPNIVKEALACDRPVVSVDVGDVAEQLEGVGRSFIAEAEPVDLAKKLYRALTETDVLVEGRQKMKDLSLEAVADRVLSVYSKVLGKTKERRAS